MIKKVQLKEDSFAYIKEELRKGGYLSKNLLKIEIERGTVYTFVPTSFNPSPGIDYGASLTYITGVSVGAEIRDSINQLISDYLETNGNNCAIFETMMIKKDPITSRSDLQYFFSHSRVYAFLKGNDENKPVSKYSRKAGGYPTIISLVSMPKDDDYIIHATELTEEGYVQIIDSVDYLIIGAWDEEGYLIWCK